MNRKLVTALVSACALAGVMVGPASASASTLTLNSWIIGTWPATVATFDDAAGEVMVVGNQAGFMCDEFTIGTEITQNEANPVTLQAYDGFLPLAIDGCEVPNTTIDIEYSDIELTGPMTFNADGTGELPLRLTETWNGNNGTWVCQRAGVLDLTYTPNQHDDPVYLDGYLIRTPTSGLCPAGNTTSWEGAFNAPTDDFGSTIEWVVTP